jgi:hypothetical protein
VFLLARAHLTWGAQSNLTDGAQSNLTEGAQSYLAAALRAGECVWNKGLLKKGLGTKYCHYSLQQGFWKNIFSNCFG